MEPISIWLDNVPGLEDLDLNFEQRLKSKISKKFFRSLQEIPILEPFLLNNTKNLPDSKTKKPVMIVCPGGGYGGKAPHEGAPVARWLNSLGYHAFVLQYRVSPYRLPYPLIDLLRAIKYVRYHAEAWNIESDSLGVLGFSAGGHLSSSAGTHFDFAHPAVDNLEDPINNMNSRPDLLVLCYSVISFQKYGHEGSRRNFLGRHAAPDLIEKFSNQLAVTKTTPPTFLWHTRDDSLPYQNSELFATALTKHGIENELHIFPSGPHGLGLAEGVQDVDQWPELCAKWLKKQGWN